jgi:hypothetical protein
LDPFALLTVIGALGVVVSFLAGCRLGRERLKLSGLEERHRLFGLSVGLIILAVLLAYD